MLKQGPLRPYLQKSIALARQILPGVVLVVLLLILLIHLPFVQRFAKNQAVAYLQAKIKTSVQIDTFSFGLFQPIRIKGLFLADQKMDTLFAGQQIIVDVKLFDLLSNKLTLNTIDLQGITAKIDKNAKGNYNFDYLLNAFENQETKTKPSTSSLAIVLNKMNFNEIRLLYQDAKDPMQAMVKIKHFDTQFQTFDLENQILAIPKINLVGCTVTFDHTVATYPNQPAVNAIPSPPARPWKINLREIDLRKIQLDYAENSQKTKGHVSFKRWYTKLDLIDLTNELVVIRKIQFDNLRGAVSFGKITKIAAPKTHTPAAAPNKWEVKIQQTEVAQLYFQWDDHNVAPLPKGIDFNHLQWNKAHFKAVNFHYTPESIAANIVSFAGKERSGLQIDSLHTDFFYGPRNSYLKNLYLKTPQTLLRNQVHLGYPSLDIMTENPSEISVKVKVSESRLGYKDVMILAPQLATINPFATNPNGFLLLNTTITGKLKRLEIPNLELSGIGKTKLKANGRIIGLPEVDKAKFDITLQNFETSAQDITQFAPKGSLPKTISLPKQLSGKATFKGSFNSFFTDVSLQSSFGQAKVKATVDLRQKNTMRYDAQAELVRFDLGRMLQNAALGKISAKTNVKGIGLDPKTALVKTAGSVSSVTLQNYVYQNVTFFATTNKGTFYTQLKTNDPNLKLNLEGRGKWKGELPEAEVKLHIDIADLEKLNLHAGPLKLKGDLDASLLSSDWNHLNGSLLAHELVITNEKGSFPADSIQIKAISTAKESQFYFSSGFMDASVTGVFQWAQLAASFENSRNVYFNADSKFKKNKIAPQQISFSLLTKESPLFAQLLPNVKELAPIVASGSYNSPNDSLIMHIKIPKLVYNDQEVTNTTFDIKTADNAVQYQLFVDNFQNPQMQLPFTLLSGKVMQNKIDYTLQLKDISDKERYNLSGTIQKVRDNLLFNLDPKSLVLNYDNWKLLESNLIRLSPQGLTVLDFKLENRESSVTMQSDSQEPNAPLAITFKNFDIQTITNLVEKDDYQMSGKINGATIIKGGITQPLFTSDIKIDAFAFKKDTVGDISIQVKNENENKYAAKVVLSGQDNSANLEGNYESKTGNYDLKLVIDTLNIKSIQGFSLGQLENSIGFLSGNFETTRNNAPAIWNGKLQFNQVGFKVKQLNASFDALNDAITFDSNSINLKRLTLKDERGNTLVVDGKITTNAGQKMALNIAIDADDFRAINSQASDNDLFYGELFLNNHITITGAVKNPKIEGKINVNKETNFTIVVPQSDPSISDREGIVEFVDQDHPIIVTTTTDSKESNQSDITGINASLDITVDKEAELTLIIDKASGDYVKVKGQANLNGGIDASGKTSLTGKYEVAEGIYEMTFSGIKRKFDIKKGSYILWKGEPSDADINIVAVYKTSTAPIDLVLDQINGFSDAEKATFKEKIPFETELKMTGQLLKPEISFDIILPENNTVSANVISTTKSRLQQLRQEPNNMNKQVFALLVLGNFMGDNPLASESGFSAESLARGSASKILSNQLNNLASDLIKGVELNFDLQATEDYSSGKKNDRTDLNVGITKKLFNEHLKVTVGSSFELEGSQQVNEKSSNIAGDVSIDYQISKDGRYKLRGYRVNKYQVALQGEVIETGISFVITMDYNKFKELFQKSK
ncbi:MAG: translocation/assembly module TamB domain-containing protein [Flavobacterium sp.]